jgi:putative oxidoreductase
MGAAGVIEFFGGLLIASGILTSYAAFIASGEMAFAYFTRHLPGGFWPIQNGGELAVLYCFLFLYIAANGATPWGRKTDQAASESSAGAEDVYRTHLQRE